MMNLSLFNLSYSIKKFTKFKQKIILLVIFIKIRVKKNKLEIKKIWNNKFLANIRKFNNQRTNR